MRPDWKTCFRICASVFALYLCIFYWESLSKLLGTLVSALSPLILGLVIAYVLNILMSVYERHYFPKSRRPWAKNSRPVICLLAAVICLFASGFSVTAGLKTTGQSIGSLWKKRERTRIRHKKKKRSKKPVLQPEEL